MRELRNIRKARGLTVQACIDALAAKGVKISHAKWTRLEGSRSARLTDEERDAVADLLGATLDQLAGRAEFVAEPVAS